MSWLYGVRRYEYRHGLSSVSLHLITEILHLKARRQVSGSRRSGSFPHQFFRDMDHQKATLPSPSVFRLLLWRTNHKRRFVGWMLPQSQLLIVPDERDLHNTPCLLKLILETKGSEMAGSIYEPLSISKHSMRLPSGPSLPLGLSPELLAPPEIYTGKRNII